MKSIMCFLMFAVLTEQAQGWTSWQSIYNNIRSYSSDPVKPCGEDGPTFDPKKDKFALVSPGWWNAPLGEHLIMNVELCKHLTGQREDEPAGTCMLVSTEKSFAPILTYRVGGECKECDDETLALSEAAYDAYGGNTSKFVWFASGCNSGTHKGPEV